MNCDDRSKLARDIMNNVLIPILETKGPDYSSNDDINSNFPTAAERMREGIDKYDVWHIYFHKHMSALETWLEDKKVKSEPIEGRIADIINYLIILWSMAIDDGMMKWPEDNLMPNFTISAGVLESPVGIDNMGIKASDAKAIGYIEPDEPFKQTQFQNVTKKKE